MCHPARLIPPARLIETLEYITRPKRNTIVLCQSHVGMTGGRQKLTLSSHCSSTDIRHEIGHLIGLYHHHNRPDRDQYIEIIEDNVNQKKWKNFKKCEKCWHFGTEYDYRSIMHYKSNAFSSNGLVTMQPLVIRL